MMSLVRNVTAIAVAVIFVAIAIDVVQISSRDARRQ